MQETPFNNPGVRRWDVHRLDAEGEHVFKDLVVVEEPLEIRIAFGPQGKRSEIPLSITMRTPGDDLALVTGFLLTEGIIQSYGDLQDIRQSSENVVTAQLQPKAHFNPGKVQRHFYTTSSCGVCGKASIDMVRQVSPYRLVANQPQVQCAALLEMGEKLRKSQPVFDATGGIHATALFTADGKLIATKEDIGRHNAMDKLIGWSSNEGLLPLTNHIVIVSGRGGFELIQKAVAAGVSIFAAVGAPSSLAVELAEENDMTLVGFLKTDRLNVYTHPGRVIAMK